MAHEASPVESEQPQRRQTLREAARNTNFLPSASEGAGYIQPISAERAALLPEAYDYAVRMVLGQSVGAEIQDEAPEAE